MATASVKSNLPGETESTTLRSSESVLTRLLKYLGLMVIDATALLIVYALLFDSNTGLAVALGLITLVANVIVLVPSLYSVRWITPGLILVSLFVIYPIFYTVTTAFTNYSNVGHPLPKDQAIRQIITVGGNYASPDAPVYSWVAAKGTYVSDDGTYALWLTRQTDSGVETILAPAGKPVIPIPDAPADPPATYAEYKLSEEKAGILLQKLKPLSFGADDQILTIQSLRAVSGGVPKFVYDEAAGTITNQESGKVYIANDTEGYFQLKNGGETLQPGYRVFIGFGNFTRLASDPALRGPLIDIFIWTITFALFSVLTCFALGLTMAMILNDPIIPARKIIRSILLIPYAVPGVIGIVVWRGMLNLNLGIVNDVLNTEVNWLNHPIWSKVALVLVNLWLGYPYMMLICSGALQSIPSEVYEASSVDGANPWQKFWNITLPLLLVAMGPLLIGSFVFNFNNYLLITALTGGNPPIPGSPIPGVGQTDILISYVYKSAFSNQADYGYASAITIIIFFIVAAITLVQYRYTRTWEQVSENV
ncbi:MAG TPA: ABC transporter permease subunit [Phototrophicaceae bacterium]|jgi:ABC-type sugar transport system permease subunit|nr:ABC transporter permease subunit [Phototrophicaceae bacterium]